MKQSYLLITIPLLLLGCAKEGPIKTDSLSDVEPVSVQVKPEAKLIVSKNEQSLPANNDKIMQRESSGKADNENSYFGENIQGWTYVPKSAITKEVIADIKDKILQCNYQPIENPSERKNFIESSLCMELAGYHHVDRPNGICTVDKYKEDELCKQFIYDLYESGL